MHALRHFSLITLHVCHIFYADKQKYATFLLKILKKKHPLLINVKFDMGHTILHTFCTFIIEANYFMMLN